MTTNIGVSPREIAPFLENLQLNEGGGGGLGPLSDPSPVSVYAPEE